MRSARALYRTRQVLNALRPRLDEDALHSARGLMSPPESDLFFAMEKRDQRHALEVMSRLQHDHHVEDPALLRAALLHDCGKGSVPVWLRIAKVLSPGFVAGAGSETSAGWRAAAYRLSNHAEIGAKLAENAGSEPLTVALIRGRVGGDDVKRLALLMAADDES